MSKTLTSNIVIKGPDGAGKTQRLCEHAAKALKAGMNILFVSTEDDEKHLESVIRHYSDKTEEGTLTVKSCMVTHKLNEVCDDIRIEEFDLLIIDNYIDELQPVLNRAEDAIISIRT